MVENTNKKQKKGSISEGDVSSLLQRYTANTVLALLQEVAQFPDVKLDWNALVKKTSTGISNAREYQMLWRHLAYRNTLLDKLEDNAQPLDDDSDLEYELEAFPEVSSEASTEAAACVKVLIASGLPSDSSLPNSSMVEAPLTINIPNGQSLRASTENSQPSSLMQGMNITVPVAVQKVPLPAPTPEVLDANGLIGGSMPPRKKRKPWTAEEDLELISAVQKCGEGNWANILRGDFKWDRTASQLSQRWNILRKKHGNVILGSNSSGSQLSEAQLAARHAMSLALDMPVKNITASCTNTTAGTTSSATMNNPVPSTANAEASSVANQSKLSPVGSPGSAAKSRVPLKKMPAKSNFGADSSIRAAAVAAGARIVTPSDAASLLKVAQAKKAIHIMPSGVSSIKSPSAGSASAHLEASPTTRYVRPSLPAVPSSSSPAVTSSASHPGLVKAALPKVQHNTSCEQTNAVVSVPATELQLKPEVKAGEEIKVSGCSVSGNEPSKEIQLDLPKLDAEFKNQAAVAENPDSSSNMEIVENGQVQSNGNQPEGNGNQNGNDDKMVDSPVANGENQAAVKQKNSGLPQSSNNEEAELPTLVIDKCSSKNMEV
ncbi:HTH myb-type domain-containing protein [Citrus sinensis]|uniref:HTH myb-type domain-containing protein n=1 Tax=Citrus sinensis TaxID=2711 RepID=A0ACB8KP16_CITSI|nr:HTH myb-type domain-containing protein [Citrus sinensis]